MCVIVVHQLDEGMINLLQQYAGLSLNFLDKDGYLVLIRLFSQ